VAAGRIPGLRLDRTGFAFLGRRGDDRGRANEPARAFDAVNLDTIAMLIA